jgi:single-strand DNA-binding protein
MYTLRNKVQVIGNLGNAPEVRTTPTGKKWLTFRIATNEAYRNEKGEKITETQWHSVIAWGKIAERAGQYLQKGLEIPIEAKLTHCSYVDKQGVTRYTTEIVVNELLLLGNKNTASANLQVA